VIKLRAAATEPKAAAAAPGQRSASAEAAPSAGGTQPAASNVPRTPAQTVRAVIHNSNTLRSVLVLNELLDKPLSLRPDRLDRF
jgi:hypothetical protein